jgi:hypothetical protein
VLGVVLCLALVSAGCDDDDSGGGNVGSTSTTSTSTTTVTDTTSTTVSTSTTSVTTGSTSTTSTTTGGGQVCDCVITFGVTNVETLGSLQYDTDYSASGGGFDGAAGTVSCQRVAGDFAAFNDIEASSTLSSAFISAAGFTGPTTVATCDFTGNREPATTDFGITITDQARPDFSPATATVDVTDVTCTCTGGGSTTTTVGGGTTTTTTGGGTTTTTTGGGGNLWDVTFDMADAGTAVGALQFEVAYGGAGGQFVGTADSVDCDSALSAGGAFVTFNDEDGTTTLNFAAVALAGFSGPTNVARCTFDAPAQPNAGDFVITVVDASDTALAPITPFPTVTAAVAAQ